MSKSTQIDLRGSVEGNGKKGLKPMRNGLYNQIDLRMYH